MTLSNTILIVEDSSNDLFLLQRAIQKANCTCAVRVVQNGREALEYLDEAIKGNDPARFPFPRLVFLDLTMPLASGFEVLGWFNAVPHNSIPVVVLTSSGDERDKRHALQLGAKAFIGKPATPEVIASLLERFGLCGLAEPEVPLPGKTTPDFSVGSACESR
jgi:Response regulator containing CheY-like receiver, AAA-type ATPase, and DNA-binding domains